MLRKILSSEKGTTMTEVLVAMIIVVLMTTMFAGTVNQAVKMLNKNRNKLAAMESTAEQFYTRNRNSDAKAGSELILSGNGSDIILKQSELRVFSTEGMTRYYIGVKETEAGEKESGSS